MKTEVYHKELLKKSRRRLFYRLYVLPWLLGYVILFGSFFSYHKMEIGDLKRELVKERSNGKSLVISMTSFTEEEYLEIRDEKELIEVELFEARDNLSKAEKERKSLEKEIKDLLDQIDSMELSQISNALNVQMGNSNKRSFNDNSNNWELGGENGFNANNWELAEKVGMDLEGDLKKRLIVRIDFYIEELVSSGLLREEEGKRIRVVLFKIVREEVQRVFKGFRIYNDL